MVLDEPFDVFRRIAQKQANLVGEFVVRAQTLDELHQALLAAAADITCVPQNLRRQLVLQIPLQIAWAVQIQQRALVRESQREEAESFGNQHLVILADLHEQSLPVFIRAGEQAAGLDPGQCRRTEPYDVFLRHGLPPCLWWFTGFRAVSNAARLLVKAV